jgi:hypothetical protein
MVNDEGQLYTIEGFTAALIMMVTAILVFSTTTVYTPGDEHIADMQLEQLGNDALLMMDTPDSVGGVSDLQEYVKQNNDPVRIAFNSSFTEYLQKYTDTTRYMNDLRYTATIFYRNSTGGVSSYPFSWYGYPDIKYRDNIAHDPSVMATRWVKLDDRVVFNRPGDMEDREQYVLIEVLIWHGGIEL